MAVQLMLAWLTRSATLHGLVMQRGHSGRQVVQTASPFLHVDRGAA